MITVCWQVFHQGGWDNSTLGWVVALKRLQGHGCSRTWQSDNPCFPCHLFNKAALLTGILPWLMTFFFFWRLLLGLLQFGVFLWSTGSLNQGESNVPRCLEKLRFFSSFMNHHRLHGEERRVPPTCPREGSGRMGAWFIAPSARWDDKNSYRAVPAAARNSRDCNVVHRALWLPFI